MTPTDPFRAALQHRIAEHERNHAYVQRRGNHKGTIKTRIRLQEARDILAMYDQHRGTVTAGEGDQDDVFVVYDREDDEILGVYTDLNRAVTIAREHHVEVMTGTWCDAIAALPRQDNEPDVVRWAAPGSSERDEDALGSRSFAERRLAQGWVDIFNQQDLGDTPYRVVRIEARVIPEEE